MRKRGASRPPLFVVTVFGRRTMKVRAVVILCQLALAGVASEAQERAFPGDLSGLLARAQEVRTLLAAGQMIESLEFILPEKRNDVLSAGRAIYRSPRVVGIDLTDDRDRVIVRVAVEIPGLAGSGARTEWVSRDPWVRVDDVWYLDVGSFDDVWRGGVVSESTEVDLDALEREFDGLFTLIDDFVDVGTVNRGDPTVIPIRIDYSGDTPITIESPLKSEFLMLDRASASQLSSDADSFRLRLVTERWEGPFRMPLPLTIHYKSATIDRTLTVAGNVFVPLTIRREVVENSDTYPGHVRFSILNNTDSTVHIGSVLVDDKLDVMGFSRTIEAGEEGFIDLRRQPGVEPPPELTLILTEPLLGRRALDFPVDFGS